MGYLKERGHLILTSFQGSKTPKPGTETKREKQEVEKMEQQIKKAKISSMYMQQASNVQAAAEAKNQPEMKFRAGAISATVWHNNAHKPDGTVSAYNTISFERGYKDKAGEWKSTNSLRVADIPKAVVVLNKAFEYLVMKSSFESEA